MKVEEETDVDTNFQKAKASEGSSEWEKQRKPHA
ncbi:hypothetical protein CCACVL1_11048 [Corchorus capsularis]|uniref:Uncharacterized protein n=1 Tax=Corchorus capsularis TaxID=210143 RepID=A0A1R3IN31_COCAP|nr:hypothetical protein CCACVL1_11048 [Corchorus capsularis]